MAHDVLAMDHPLNSFVRVSCRVLQQFQVAGSVLTDLPSSESAALAELSSLRQLLLRHGEQASLRGPRPHPHPLHGEEEIMPVQQCLSPAPLRVGHRKVVAETWMAEERPLH